MEEVLSREDMSVEKGRELDAVFASFTVDKGAKRLSSKMKAYLAKKVDTSVDSIQAYWLCFRRNNLKWVRLCERNSWACFGLFLFLTNIFSPGGGESGGSGEELEEIFGG